MPHNPQQPSQVSQTILLSLRNNNGSAVDDTENGFNGFTAANSDEILISQPIQEGLRVRPSNYFSGSGSGFWIAL
jgi:hypothetical protein